MTDETVVHACHPLDIAGDEADVVGNDEDRHRFVELAKQLEDALLRMGIDARRRFVEEEDLRLAGQRPRDQDALEFPTGEIADRFLPKMEHLEAFERLEGHPAVLRSEPSPGRGSPQSSHEDRPLHGDRKVPRKGGELRNIAEETGSRRRRGPEDRDSPLPRFEEPEDQLEERALSPSVRTDDPQKLTPLHGKRHILEHIALSLEAK